MKRGNQRGVALLICMFALLLLTAVGMSMMFMSDTESTISANYKDSQRAYFASAAGLQEVRQRLMTGAANAIGAAPAPTLAPPVLPNVGDPRGVLYVINGLPGEVVEPWNLGNAFVDDQLCHEQFRDLNLADTGANVPCGATPGAAGWYNTVASTGPFAGTAAALPYKWVRLTLKTNRSSLPYCPTGNCGADVNDVNNLRPICWDGGNQLILPPGYVPDRCDGTPPPPNGTYLTPVYRLTALAITPNGSRRMTQMEVANDPPVVTNAAVDSQDHVTLNGKLTVNGYDFCSCSCATDSNGNYVCVDRPGKVCDRGKWGIYSASTVDNPNSSETIVAGQNPPIAENQPWIYDINKLVKKYKDGASTVDVTQPPYNWSCPGTPPVCGTYSGSQFGVPPNFPPSPVDNPTGPVDMSKQVTYVPGSVQLTGGTMGNGVLVVDGDLDIHGGMQFYGLILVKGVVRFTGGGSAKTNIYGAVLAGQRSIDDTVLGGSAAISFNVCALLNNTNPAPPSLISSHELTY
jgi:hypothetical protein